MPNLHPIDLKMIAAANDASKSVSHDFTRRLPKLELHAHLSGSITRDCLHDIWLRKRTQDKDFSIEDPWVLMPPGKVSYGLDIFFDVFSRSIYNLVNDTESILYATKCVLRDFQADGVRYLELRTTPREIRDKQGSVIISKEQYVFIILRAIAEFKEQTMQQQQQQQMSVYLILSIDRVRDTAVSAEQVVDIALRHRKHNEDDDGEDDSVKNNSSNHDQDPKISTQPVIIGIDLCGNPTKGDVSLFRPAMHKAQSANLKITLHFAETIYNTTQELETLLSFAPDRLGHVIHVPEAIRREIAHKKIALELCMSCNVHAKMFEGGFDDHHFGYWYDKMECAISLCTDDVGFFCSPVSQEYYLAAKHFGLGRTELVALCERGVDSIFSGEEEKARLRKLLAEFSQEESV